MIATLLDAIGLILAFSAVWMAIQVVRENVRARRRPRPDGDLMAVADAIGVVQDLTHTHPENYLPAADSRRHIRHLEALWALPAAKKEDPR